MGELASLSPPYTCYTAKLNDKEVGIVQMSEKFKAMGEQVYVDASAVKESNKRL